MFTPVLMSRRVWLSFAMTIGVVVPLSATAQSIGNPPVQHGERMGADRVSSAHVLRIPPTGEDQTQAAADLAATEILLARASPEVRAWVQTEGQRQAQTGPSESSAAAAARERFGSDLAGLDIDSLIQLVMAETARQSEQELRDQLAAMQAANQRKRTLREGAQSMKNERAALGDEMRSGSGVVPVSGSRAALASYVASLQDGRDTMSELGEMQQLKLQMYMDRRQKALEVLSNLLKKTSDTQDTINGNLK